MFIICKNVQIFQIYNNTILLNLTLNQFLQETW